MAIFWTSLSGTTLTTLSERVTTTYALPIKSEYLPLASNNMTISLVSGTIPKGMRLSGENLVGTPLEVTRDTVYKFVVRANQNGVIDDRTYSIIVTGADAPTWVTAEDLLPVGPNNTFYIIDSAPLDFQLVATDTDLSAGDTLEYYIQEGDGELPPGIQLTTDGKLVGVVEPILALEDASGSGKYDTNNYGNYPFDFGIRPDNGFDSFFYDTVIYDTSTPSNSPKKLNRFYEFIVSVSDGDTIVKRKFRIYVVGDDFLRADNTIMQVANGVFTADNSHIRVPIWLTPANFGFRRANNYVTLFLDVIDPNSLSGVISYSLQTTNDDGSTSALPPGMALDTINGEIAGKVPYQPAVTKQYKFTIRAFRQAATTAETSFKDKTFTVSMLGEIDSVLAWTTKADLGTINSNYISTLSVVATSTVPRANLLYTLTSGSLPPGLALSYDGEIIGKINSFGSVGNLGLTVFDNAGLQLDGNTTSIDRKFKFTVKVQDHFGYSAITREFTIQVTDPDDKLYSNLYIRPMLKTTQRSNYELIVSDNNLFDSSLIYRPNDPKFGIQKTMQMLVYAGIETKSVNNYVAATAKNHKRKTYRLGDIKSAVAKTPGTTTEVYEVIYVEVIDPEDAIKKTRKHFTTFNPTERTVDQTMYNLDADSVENLEPTGLRMGTRGGDVIFQLLPAFTIGTRTADVQVTSNPISATLRSGDITFRPDVQGSEDPFRFRPVPENTVKADSLAISVDGGNEGKKYISNITNMRDNIRAVGETELNFLPLWMRTSQPGSIENLGYVKAVPLCYVKPGNSTTIINALNTANVKFNRFDFDIDRYVIDSTTGNSNEQYLLFHNYEYNV